MEREIMPVELFETEQEQVTGGTNSDGGAIRNPASTVYSAECSNIQNEKAGDGAKEVVMENENRYGAEKLWFRCGVCGYMFYEEKLKAIQTPCPNCGAAPNGIHPAAKNGSGA